MFESFEDWVAETKEIFTMDELIQQQEQEAQELLDKIRERMIKDSEQNLSKNEFWEMIQDLKIDVKFGKIADTEDNKSVLKDMEEKLSLNPDQIKDNFEESFIQAERENKSEEFLGKLKLNKKKK